MMAPLPGPETDKNSTADLSALISARRKQVRGKRLMILGAVALVLALVALAWFSPLLGLDKVSAKGSELIDDEKLAEFVMERHGGTPLPQIRPGALETEISEEFPKAKKVSIGYAGPRSLTVTITDRVPVLAVTKDEKFELFDAEAVNLGVVDEAPEGVTTLKQSQKPPDAETINAVVSFMSELSEQMRGHLTTISASGPDSLQGQVTAGDNKAEVIFGDGSAASLKIQTAVQLVEDGRTEIDVSVPSVPVTN